LPLTAQDKTISRWCLANGTMMMAYKGHTGPVNAVCVQDNVLYSGSDDKTGMRWDIDTGEVLCTFQGHVAGVIAVCCGLAKTFCTGSDDCTVREWDIRKGKCNRILQHTEPVVELHCLKAGTIIVGISPTGLCKMWTGKTRELVFTGRGLKQWENYKEFLPPPYQNPDVFGDGQLLGTSFAELMHILHIGPEDVGSHTSSASDTDDDAETATDESN
jgi:WD40 repeat protein